MSQNEQKPAARGYHCKTCGKYHDELPLHYGAATPVVYYDIPEAERETRVRLNSDQCVIDDQYFFIVGNIDIPIIGHDEMFSWDVWVSLSEKSFAHACENWYTPGRENCDPYFGWLCTALPGYPNTLSLKTHVHSREVGRRPYIELEPTDHPLAVEQRTGITWGRVQEIAELVLHQHE